MREAQLRFLSALHEATRRGAIRWRLVDDDDRDIYRAAIKEAHVDIEFVYVMVAGGECAERYVARVSGLGSYFQVAIGTEGYETIESMLCLQVFGWEEGHAGALKALDRATSRVVALVSETLPRAR